jgi:hypothetical protein
VLATSAIATALGLLVAAGGLWRVAPGVPAGPRFWATVFFVLLLWPVGLTLLGRMAGLWVQRGAAAALLLAAAGQQVANGALPLPEHVRWHATLAAPGDAVRQTLRLPESGDAQWGRAWGAATRVAIAICTGGAVAPETETALAVNGGPPVALSTLTRAGPPPDDGWYLLPVARGEVEPPAGSPGAGTLDVVVRRRGAAGPPVLVCGGRDDPQRPGAGGASRQRDGVWSTEDVADWPLPDVAGRRPVSRYYVELRFFDRAGRPSVAIYY